MKRILIAIAATTLLAGVGGAHAAGSMGRGVPGPGMMGYGVPGSSGGYEMMGPGMMEYGMGCPMAGFAMMGRGSTRFEAQYPSLELSDTQRGKVLAIERAAWRKQWELMGKMHDQHLIAQESYAAGVWNEQLLRKNYEVLNEVHKEIFETSLQARKDIEAVLTPEQRSQINNLSGNR